MLRDGAFPTLLESQEMGRTVQSQSRGKEVREEKQRLDRTHSCRIYCKTSSSTQSAFPEALLSASLLRVSSWWSIGTCQVLLGAGEEEDEIYSFRNSRNFQSHKRDDK